jgi:hypothetical protein
MVAAAVTPAEADATIPAVAVAVSVVAIAKVEEAVTSSELLEGKSTLFLRRTNREGRRRTLSQPR